MGALSHIFLGKPKASASPTSDGWVSQHRLHDQNKGYDLNALRDRDRLYDQAVRDAERWQFTAKMLGATAVIGLLFGAYGIMQPETVTKYALVDRNTGERISTVSWQPEIPDVLMNAEFKQFAMYAFSRSKDDVVEARSEQYRAETFINDAASILGSWIEIANKRSDLRIATFRGASQHAKDKSMWDAEFEVKEYSGQNLILIYTLKSTVRFEISRPTLGLWLDNDDGFKIPFMTISEIKA